jgi:hypothetical protein
MVGGNPPSHLGDFYEGIRIRALFSKGQCGPCVVCGEEGLKEVGEDWERHSKLLEWGHWECRTLIKKEGKNR